MKRLIIAVTATALTFTLTACNGDVTQGTSCDQIGSKHTNKDGTPFVCQRNVDTGKGFWRANP